MTPGAKSGRGRAGPGPAQHLQEPRDRIIWDVGHQSYPHKLLTGRWERFHTLRRHGGLSGFPKVTESVHDPFGTGHSSTSISAALGLAEARDQRGERAKIIAVIGDGALTGGMAFEALNHAGHLKSDLMVVLNDNKMSIGTNVGALSAYLDRIRSDPAYSRLKEEFEQRARRVPLVGHRVVDSAEKIRKGLKSLIKPGLLFEELGLAYFGPVDGHNIAALKSAFRQTARVKGPVLLHVLTEKGKGYRYAEAAPERFHGIGPFDLQNGLPRGKKSGLSYTGAFGQTLVRLAAGDSRIVALTAAMTAGTGLKEFASRYPQRFYDVGIAEQHAVGMAAALAAGGLRPVVAIYSTFLQRAYDQIIHDVCMQNLPVILQLTGRIVGEDGETHQGIFDLALRSAPQMALMAPCMRMSCSICSTRRCSAAPALQRCAIPGTTAKGWDSPSRACCPGAGARYCARVMTCSSSPRGPAPMPPWLQQKDWRGWGWRRR